MRSGICLAVQFGGGSGAVPERNMPGESRLVLKGTKLFGCNHRRDFADLNRRLDLQEQLQRRIMAGITDIINAEAQEHSDLAALTALVPQLLTAFASGQMTPAQAQALVDGMSADDSTIKTTITSIQAALPAAAATT